MKHLLRLLIPASLILLFCLPLMAQDENKDYPNFQLLSDAEQAAYDSAPQKILSDARAAFKAAKYDRAIALCNYHYIYYGDKVSEIPGGSNELKSKNDLDAKAKRCYDLSREMNDLIKSGNLARAKEKAKELFKLNNQDERALAVLMQTDPQKPDTVFVTVPQPQKPDTVFVTVPQPQPQPQPQKLDTVFVTVPVPSPQSEYPATVVAPEPQPHKTDTAVLSAPVETNEPESTESYSFPILPQEPVALERPTPKEEYKPRTTFVVKAGAGRLNTQIISPQVGLGLYDLGGSRVGLEADAYKCVGESMLGVDAGLVFRVAKPVYLKAGAGCFKYTDAESSDSTQGMCGMAGLVFRIGKHFCVDAGLKFFPEIKVHSKTTSSLGSVNYSFYISRTALPAGVAPVICIGWAF